MKGKGGDEFQYKSGLLGPNSVFSQKVGENYMFLGYPPENKERKKLH